jgi:hypothetical protein
MPTHIQHFQQDYIMNYPQFNLLFSINQEIVFRTYTIHFPKFSHYEVMPQHIHATNTDLLAIIVRGSEHRLMLVSWLLYKAKRDIRITLHGNSGDVVYRGSVQLKR